MIATIESEQGRTQESALLGRARTVFRRTARDLRDSLAQIAQLEEAATRCYVDEGQEIDEEVVNSVAGLLREVREQHPNQELEVIILAAPMEARGGERNGQQDRTAGPV